MFLRQNGLFRVLSCIAFSIFALTANAQDQQFELGLPIDCTLGVDCFIQQMTDMDMTKGVSDPYCGIVAYDGHILDPFTGRLAEEGCASSGNTWWSDPKILDAANNASF